MTWRVVVVVAACGSAAEVPMMPSNQAATSIPAVPDLARLRSLLAPHDRDAFTEDAIENRACQKGTLGDYIALLYREGKIRDRSAGRSGVLVLPDRIDQQRRWHYELRIRVRKSDLDLDFGTMTCPGTP